MRCREVEALWDEVRDGDQSLREAVHGHLRACPPCQDLYEQYEGVAYCLSCLAAAGTFVRFGEKNRRAHRRAKYRARRIPDLADDASIRRSAASTSDTKGRASRYIGLDRGEPPEPCANASSAGCTVPSRRRSAGLADELFDEFLPHLAR